MRRRKREKLVKQGISLATAVLLACTPVVGVLMQQVKVQAAISYVEDSSVVDLEQSDTELYVGSDWAGTEASCQEDGTTVEISVGSYGWNGEWGLQYIIHDIGLEDYGSYEVAFAITSDIDKKIFVKLDDAGFIEDTLELKANETYNYNKTVECGVFSNQKVFFALGQMAGEDANLSGTMTISNLKFSKVEGSSVSPTGKEYDFSATEDNLTHNYGDMGVGKDGYNLIWADEFNGAYGEAEVDLATGLNLDNWSYQLGDGTTDCGNPGWGNRELQCYTGNQKNIAVNEDLSGDGNPDGLLRITASYEGSGYTYAGESAKKYTSARIRTTSAVEPLFSTTYGYVEARMSLPGTAGAWPAFWMLPESTSIYGNWPVSGEIDIMETCGAFSNGSNAQVCGTLHWGAPEHVYKGSGYVTLGSDYTYFHTYAIDWKPGEITWYVDGQPIYTSTNWESGFSGASDTLSFDAPFDQPFYMLLNLAVDSGQFGGSINKATFQDAINMYVDYVRVYQKSDGYADSVDRAAAGSSSVDWSDYAGQNQIASITTDNLVTDVADGNVNALESNHTSDMSKWYLAYQSDAVDATGDTVTDANGVTWAKVGVQTPGSQDYSVQLIGHYNAKKGYLYRVSFDAYAEGGLVGKTVNCDSKEWAGWSTYGILSFDLKNTPTSYSYLIQQTDDFDDCRIEFNLGAKGSGTIYLGNIRVEIVDPSLLGQESDVRSPLADGNLIYNGTFDQGSRHFGYWNTLAGTAVSIPRYTTEKITEGDVSVVDVASKTNYEQIADGVKYYERRAQISGVDGGIPGIYQKNLTMMADAYALKFDLYSKMDTDVTAEIYEVKEENGEEKLGKKLATSTVRHQSAGGVQSYLWKFDLTEKVDNAALVLKFGKGTSVQLDNVSLCGKSQGAKADANPLTTETQWHGDSGSGQSLALTTEQGAHILQNVTSNASAWYSPQIISDDFSLTAGKQYKFQVKYKLEGTSNNTLQYIIQENGGGWHVYHNGPTTVTYDVANADADGYCSYETVFGADTSLDTVHAVFGLGNSEADGNCTFSFKDAVITLVDTGTAEETDGSYVMFPAGGNVATDKVDWDTVISDLINGTAGTKETISLKEESQLPKEFLEAIQGKDVNVSLEVGDGLVWNINGMQISVTKEGIDLGVKVGTTEIPATLIESLAGENDVIQLSLNYDGTFGFTAELEVTVGNEYVGKYANLFYYNETTKALEYVQAVKVDEYGVAALTFTHASDYVLVLADEDLKGNENQANPATDTNTNHVVAGVTVTPNTVTKTTATPQTGDHAPLANAILLLLSGCVVLAGASGKYRKVRK